MRVGRVEWYSEKRGFGILSAPASDGAVDKFYVHVTKIIGSPGKIEFGQHAEFEVSDTPIRRPGDFPMAVNVTITADDKAGYKSEETIAGPQPERDGGAK